MVWVIAEKLWRVVRAEGLIISFMFIALKYASLKLQELEHVSWIADLIAGYR